MERTLSAWWNEDAYRQGVDVIGVLARVRPELVHVVHHVQRVVGGEAVAAHHVGVLQAHRLFCHRRGEGKELLLRWGRER